MSTITRDQSTASPLDTERTAGSLALRLGGVGLLAGIAWVHVLDLPGKWSEVRYLGVGYVLLIAACVVSAVMLLARDRRGWMLGGAVAGLTLVGFVLNRTVGLPAATDDIGNWSETLGVWSLVLESAMVALSVAALRLRPRAGLAAG
jgi:hypothetical protein